MFTGMIIGANIWFVLFMLGCLCCIWDNHHNNLNEIKCSNVLIWIIIFSFVGGIIGHIFSLTMSIGGFQIGP